MRKKYVWEHKLDGVCWGKKATTHHLPQSPRQPLSNLRKEDMGKIILTFPQETVYCVYELCFVWLEGKTVICVDVFLTSLKLCGITSRPNNHTSIILCVC